MPRAFFLLLCLACAACARDEPDTPAPPPPRPAEQTKPGTLRVEGMEEAVTLREVDVPEAPFTTFMPDSFFVVTAAQDEHGFDVRFVAADDTGQKFDDVYAAFVFPEHVNADSVYADVTSPDGMLATRVWELSSAGVSPCLWAEQGYTYRDVAGNASGILCIGTHRGRPFYLLTHVPGEWADGFSPRLDVLLDEFRWRDTGAGLL